MTQNLPAVILAAGRGERLSGQASSPPKPLAPLLGLTLLERVILSCKAAGVSEVYVVLGFRKEEVQPRLSEWQKRHEVSIHAVDNPVWLEGNGTSVLACAPHLSSPFVVVMGDHLIDPTAISHLIEQGKNEETCCLLVDYRVDRIFDPQDATRVHVDKGKITAIGKGLEPYNGIDTGNFFCRPFLFDALKEVRAEGDGSLTGAIRRVADQGKVRAVDYGDRFWLDVDTPEALEHGRKTLLTQAVKTDEDGFIAKWLNRRLSLRISARLLAHPVTARLRPTAISLLSFLIVLMGALLFVPKGYAASLFAAILIQLGSVLDGCDGEVARLTFRSSRFGAWLDTLLDRYGDAAVAVGITWGFWRLYPTPWVWFGGMIALTGFLLTSYTKKEYALRYRKSIPRGIWMRLIKRDLRLFGLFLGAILGYPYFALLVLGLFSHIGIGRLFWKVSRGVQS
ncbi:MAG TPA: NTP transferase domain-containing protein [Candidatus Heimdallarchaeota archaeon]|nr:NTP transferase domain-containing protein [Candidatus Heimdallarchaeota archaeon]